MENIELVFFLLKSLLSLPSSLLTVLSLASSNLHMIKIWGLILQPFHV